jgi:hypothetical protein
MPRIQLKRGLTTNLPTAGMLPGEALFATDRGTMHVATSPTTRLSIVPAIETLATLPGIDGAADFLIIHDASETAAPKEKKMAFNAFKASLAIPPGSSDEKTAVASGGTPGYIWGADGTDGVIRMNSSMAWSKDPGNAFVTLAVGDIDLGTF